MEKTLLIQDEAPLEVSLIPQKRGKAPDPGEPSKYAAIFGIGFLTLGYSVMEIYYAMKVESLALLSDGFHNLSDVIALMIAFWAIKQSSVSRTDNMTYGWKRAEILGAVMNGCFLLALCLYILLESIPRFIAPPNQEEGSSWIFISVSGAGLFVNLIGTIVFAVSGHGHSHAGGGGHSHGGGGHSHGGHGDKQEKKEKHGHAHGDGDDHGHGHKEKKEKHGHAHGDGDDHGHGHKKEKKEKHGHAHGDDHGHKNKDKKDKHGHGDKHGHAHGDDHSHDHDHDAEDPERGHVHKHKEDMNMHAVFIHYLGDALSSLMVLIAGLLMHFFPGSSWVIYLDPISSVLIVVLILVSVIPLIKNCSVILLQQAPAEVDTAELKRKLEKVPGIEGVHDMHVWQLVDSMVICSLHVQMLECDPQTFKTIVSRCKNVLHKFGIHSSTLQPEFIKSTQRDQGCIQNCVEDCPEDWCCKEEVLAGKIEDYDSYGGVKQRFTN